MRWRTVAVAASLVAAATVGAVVVFAQLGDTETASGTVNVSTTSADLYICEPDSTAGPECGSDDTGADEAVFETLEDIRPGETREWDIRLKNVSTQDWFVTGITLTVVETVDPGADCPDDALKPVTPESVAPWPVDDLAPGAWVLGKNGDDLNDNPQYVSSGTVFPTEFSETMMGPIAVRIKVAAGDFEDVRLRLQLDLSGTENCYGNEWNVSWDFTVS